MAACVGAHTFCTESACVCSFASLCAVGVDVIFQLPRVRREGLRAQEYLERWGLWYLGARDTSLLPRKQPREVPRGSDEAQVRGRLGTGGVEGWCYGSCQLAPDNTAPCCLPGL